MSRCKASNQDILACQRSGMTVTETARLLEVSDGCVRQRAKRLRVTFAKRQGIPSRGDVYDCDNCPDRKLCVMCHRLRVEAIPCEGNLMGAAEDRLPERWAQRYALLLP